jgi:hypothetical protein
MSMVRFGIAHFPTFLSRLFKNLFIKLPFLDQTLSSTVYLFRYNSSIEQKLFFREIGQKTFSGGSTKRLFPGDIRQTAFSGGNN